MRGSDRIPPQYCKRIMRVLFAFVVLAVRTTIIRADGFLDVLSYLYRCRSKTFNECFERDLARTIDDMMGKNETYRLNRYLTMVVQNVTTGNRNSNGNVARSHDLSTRLLNLFNALHIQYQPEKPEYDFEGRKKKKDKKHKKGMMMAGAAMLMTIIGGIIMKLKMKIILLIALKALFLAKFALVLAGTIAFKKLLGNSGGTNAQPMFTSGGGDNGGYRRSYGPSDSGQFTSTASNLAYRDQISSYENIQMK